MRCEVCGVARSYLASNAITTLWMGRLKAMFRLRVVADLGLDAA